MGYVSFREGRLGDLPFVGPVILLLLMVDYQGNKTTSWGFPRPTIYKWMFGETSIFYIKIWNHPIKTSVYKLLFGVTGWLIVTIAAMDLGASFL